MLQVIVEMLGNFPFTEFFIEDIMCQAREKLTQNPEYCVF
jgi:hypothetical protein